MGYWLNFPVWLKLALMFICIFKTQCNGLRVAMAPGALVVGEAVGPGF